MDTSLGNTPGTMDTSLGNTPGTMDTVTRQHSSDANAVNNYGLWSMELARLGGGPEGWGGGGAQVVLYLRCSQEHIEGGGGEGEGIDEGLR